MLKTSQRFSLSIVIALSSVLVLSSCAKRIESGANVIELESSSSACKTSTDTISAGSITFSITNTSNKVTEVYLFASDKKSIVSEAENIGPSISRDLVVELSEGTYYIQCIPGMKGDGFSTTLEVTPGSASKAGAYQDELDQAAAYYKEFVINQATLLLQETKKFATLYSSGKEAAARELYPHARMYWERIEPVAESFGDLDPILDLREADLEEGQSWTGWHLIEKDLWAPTKGYQALTKKERTAASNMLVEKTSELLTRVKSLEYKPFQMSNGAKELLDEVATGKVTGEEEIWSGTDLYDFQANIEGAEKVYELLKSVVAKKDPALSKKLERGFANVYSLLDAQRSGTSFTHYSQLSQKEILEMAAAVDALAEPLSHLTSVVVG